MTDQAPTVSVIIPAFNRAATIRSAMESVLRQTYSDFELIVVDDGSQDGTLARAHDVSDPRIRVIENPSNMGAAGARNAGIAQARGTWIAFQDSDDEWLPRKLEKQMAFLEAPGADYVGAYCGLLTLGELDHKPGERLTVRYTPGTAVQPVSGDIVEPLLRRNLISTQTLVVRHDLATRLGGFAADTTPIEDWEFVLRLAQLGPIAFVDEPLVLQTFSPNSISRDTSRRLSSRLRVIEKNADLFRGKPEVLAQQYYILAGGHRRQGDIAKARRYISEARRLRPADPRTWAQSLLIGAVALLGRRKVQAPSG